MTGKKTFTFLLVLVALVQLSQQTIDYCSTNKANDIVPLIGDQLTAFPLGNYIRGYNLKFQSDNPISARPWNPVEFIASTTLAFDEGYKIVNVDVLESVDKKWYGQGVILTQKNNTNIGIGMGKFSGAKTLLSDTKYKYFKLPLAANCFSAQIIDSSYNLVIDCQSTDGNQDLVCFIDAATGSLSCSQIDSLNDVKDRKAQTVVINGQNYLITATYSRNPQQKQMTYLTIYHVDVDQTFVDFVNIIDGYQLGLDQDIVISDFDIASDSRIIIHDVKKSRILFVKYSLPNQITLDQKPWVYGSDGVQIQVTSTNTLMVATSSNINQYSLELRTRIFHYQLDKTENQIVDIAVNNYGIIAQTSKGQILIYERSVNSINNLLGKRTITGKDYLLALYSNVLYLVDERGFQIHQFSSGILYLSQSQLTKDTKVTIKAKSTSVQCSFTVMLLKKTDEDRQKIVIKQDITTKHFKSQADSTIALNLQEIYSGENLRYSTPDSTQQLKYSLDQMSTYKLTTNLNNALMTQVVNFKKDAFMFIGITKQNVYIELCTVQPTGQQVICGIAYQAKLWSQDPVTLLSAKQRKNGQIVFVWTYTGNRFETIHYFNGKFNPMFVMAGQDFDKSSITISQDKIYFTLKQFGQIQVLEKEAGVYQVYFITNKNFKPNSNDQITGFYPRQVYLHPHNNDLFYVKLLQHVCLMTLINNEPVTIQCTEATDKLLPDQSWGIVFGQNSYVIFTPDAVSQIAYSGLMPLKLHDVKLDSDYTFPIYYSAATNSIVFKTVNDKIMYYKLSKPVIDSVYYQAGQSSYFSSEGYWTASVASSKVYRQSPQTKLNVKVIGDHQSLKQELHFTLKVSSLQDEINTDNNVTVITYPTKIDQKTVPNTLIKLPQTATNKRQSINMTQYFSGIISNYNLMCDYCSKDNITLQTLFRNPIQNKQIIGAKSFLEVFDQNVLILTNNRINLVNNKTELIVYKVIENVKQCSQMGWHPKVGLLVFCQDSTGQQILLFEVTQNEIVQQEKYSLSEGASIMVASQLILSAIDATSAYVFIQDNDISDLDEKVTKHANVKVFIISPSGLEFKGVLTSQSFGLNELQSVNDIDVELGYIVASIGNVGFGISALNTEPQKGGNILTYPRIVDFDQIDQLEKYTLDDSIFHQVEIIKLTPEQGLSIFVTSTTSIPMVVEFTWQRTGELSFSKIAQAYNRYGEITIINWQFVTQTYILLAYYSQLTQVQHIVYHPRPTTQSSNLQPFVEAHKVIIPQELILQHDVFLTSQNFLFVSDTGSAMTKKQLDESMFIGSQLPVDPKIYRLWVSPKVQFNLVLNYDTKGTFDTIKIAAANYYTSNWTTVNVQFGQNIDPDNGVKWYTILIIALVVLIIVGVGYGMYLKMLKNRKEKKVSLLTQGQADQIV